MAPLHNVLSTLKFARGTECGYTNSGSSSPQPKKPGLQKWILKGNTFLRAKTTCISLFYLMHTKSCFKQLQWPVSTDFSTSSAPPTLQFIFHVGRDQSYENTNRPVLVQVLNGFLFVCWYKYNSFYGLYKVLHGLTLSGFPSFIIPTSLCFATFYLKYASFLFS